MTSARPRLRLVKGFKKSVSPPTPLEERAFADLAFTSCLCSPDTMLEARACSPCFRRWLRGRVLEHWQGEHYWQELDRGDFGLMNRPFHPNRSLVADIVGLVMTGNENLTILTWAHENGRNVDEVVEILTTLNVNARRLPRFPWMGAAAHAAAV